MVANENEVEEIVRVICQWLPETYAFDMMTEVWDVVGQYTDNESLRETIRLILEEIENQDHIKWDGIEELK